MEPGWRNQRVCIIDDDEDVRLIYHTKFTRAGFTVHTANNGVEGIALVKKEQPDLIILDIQMPVMDGIEVLRVLKSDTQLARIPVIVLSNVDNDIVFQQVEGLQAAKYYLIKSLTDTDRVVDMAVSALAEAK